MIGVLSAFILGWIIWRAAYARQVQHHLSLVERELRHESLWNHTGNYDPGKQCIVTASFSVQLARLNCDDHVHRDALRRIRRVVGGDVINWNDAPDTTHQMVLDALRKARKLPWWWQSAPKLAGVPA